MIEINVQSGRGEVSVISGAGIAPSLVSGDPSKRNELIIDRFSESSHYGSTSFGGPLFRGGIVTPFTGKSGKPYSIETYRTGNDRGFVRIKENTKTPLISVDSIDLVLAVKKLYLSVYPERAEKNGDLAVERVMRSLSHPRTILELVVYQGVPVGYGVFPRLTIDPLDPSFQVLYSSRAILKEYEGDGVGTHLLKGAIRKHQEELIRAHKAPLRAGMLMTQSAHSERSLEILKEEGVIDKIYPFDETIDKHPLGKKILYGVHAQVFMVSDSIDGRTGVSRGELRELGKNEAFRVPREGTESYRIHERMVNHPPDGFGMNRDARDVIYILFTFPRPNYPPEEVKLTASAA